MLCCSGALTSLSRAYSKIDMGNFLGAGIQIVELETEICETRNFVKRTHR